jgi:hypothetical protein
LRIASAKALSLALGLCCSVALHETSASAEQFSADLVTMSARGQASGGVGKVYVGNGVVRIETPDLRNGRFLVNAGASTAFFVMPAQRVFIDAKRSSRLAQILVPVDPGDPCRAWQAMAKIAGGANDGARWQCERLGADAVGGMTAVKYRATSPRGDADYGWIDLRLRFPVKFTFADGAGFALDNIREAPQPATLFAIPADYRKFDPQRLTERIKQSDVWVAPPK